MGGRGSFSKSNTGAVKANQVRRTEDMIVMRGEKQAEVDQVLQVLREVSDRYGINVEQAQVAYLTPSQANVMAYYDSNGNLAVNATHFDAAKMTQAYDICTQNGFHPDRGNRTGLEAVAAHEIGHRLTDVAGERAGYGSWAISKTSDEIINNAMRSMGYTGSQESFRSRISGYGAQSNHEAIAEAFSDVFCNNINARQESVAIVNALNRFF